MISIGEYDTQERAAKARFGNDVLWAYTPVTFGANGYPARVQSEAELIRYVDPMKEYLSRFFDDEDRFHRLYSLRSRFSKAEAAMLTEVREGVGQMTMRRWGRRIVPLNSPVSAVGLLRVIEALSDIYGRKLSVLEVGPGAGYLGLLLATRGHAYTATDATQAFYLWQERLWEGRDNIAHLPWWEYVNSPRLNVDVVVCEQALCEMHAWAMRYTLRFLVDITRASDVGLLLFSGHGHPQNPISDFDRAVEEVGLQKRLEKNVFAYQAPGKNIRPEVASLDDEIPAIGGNAVLKPSDFLRQRKEELPLDLLFRERIGVWPFRSLFASG